MIHLIFDRVGVPFLVVSFCALFIAEARFRLRRRTAPKLKRMYINFVLSFPAFALLRFLLIPAMIWIAARNEGWQFGVNYLYDGPVWAKAFIAFVLLDYTNYIWHLLNHKLEFLWRFHLVHHTDPDLDITTAVRFHFGEMIGSVVFRGLMVLLTGASPFIVLVYEIVFETATQFHHSNWKLPMKFERLLNKIFVTPRMHGIHHSVLPKETDSNYSVIFSFWDRLHRTFRFGIHHHDPVTGVLTYSDPKELTIGFLLKLPFTKIRR